jgi:hypothetical protein
LEPELPNLRWCQQPEQPDRQRVLLLDGGRRHHTINQLAALCGIELTADSVRVQPLGDLVLDATVDVPPHNRLRCEADHDDRRGEQREVRKERGFPAQPPHLPHPGDSLDNLLAIASRCQRIDEQHRPPPVRQRTIMLRARRNPSDQLVEGTDRVVVADVLLLARVACRVDPLLLNRAREIIGAVRDLRRFPEPDRASSNDR